MRAWRALLWKESREELPKVLVGLGLCAVVVALRQNAEFNEDFARNFNEWIAIFVVVYGIGLGMHLVAKESSKGTLSFLLGKPLSAVGVLLPKYVVGAAALLAVTAGAWATVYLDLEGLASKGFSIYSYSGAWSPDLKRLAEEVGYANMLLVSLAPGLAIYSLIFASSPASDHPLKGAALGVLLLIALGIGIEASNVLEYFPALKPAFYFDIGIGKDKIVRMVGDPWLYFVRLGATVAAMAAGVAVSIALLRHFRGASLGWKPIVSGWLAVIAFTTAMNLTSDPPPPQLGPLSILTPEEGAYLDLAVVGDRGYVATEGGLAVVDLRDPTKPEPLAAVDAPLWSMRRIAVVDSLAYLLGQRKGLPADSLGIAVFSVGDPAQPVFKGYRIIGDDINTSWDWDRCGEGLILNGRWGGKLGIVSFALDAEGLPARADELVVEELEADYIGWWAHKLSVHIHNERIWVGYGAGFLAVDARNLEALQEAVRVEMGDYNSDYDAHKSRLITREGNTLYVQRYWPGDLVAFDITDPNAPREMGYWSFSARNTIKIINGWVYSTGLNGLSAYRQTPYHTYEYVGYWQAPDKLLSLSSFASGWRRLHFVRDHFYTLIGRSLMVFPLEQAQGGRL